MAQAILSQAANLLFHLMYPIKHPTLTIRIVMDVKETIKEPTENSILNGRIWRCYQEHYL
jgi:hypothetical protein